MYVLLDLIPEYQYFKGIIFNSIRYVPVVFVCVCAQMCTLPSQV